MCLGILEFATNEKSPNIAVQGNLVILFLS